MSRVGCTHKYSSGLVTVQRRHSGCSRRQGPDKHAPGGGLPLPCLAPLCRCVPFLPPRPHPPPPLPMQLPELAEFEVGLANLFVQHTSASLTINENASPGMARLQAHPGRWLGAAAGSARPLVLPGPSPGCFGTACCGAADALPAVLLLPGPCHALQQIGRPAQRLSRLAPTHLLNGCRRTARPGRQPGPAGA